MSTQIASTFPNEGNQYISRSNGAFLILKVINFCQTRSGFEETTKRFAPESYFIHNYSQDKLLQTTFSVFNFTYLISLMSQIAVVSKFCAHIFLLERQQNSLFLLYFPFFSEFFLLQQ